MLLTTTTTKQPSYHYHYKTTTTRAALQVPTACYNRTRVLDDLWIVLVLVGWSATSLVCSVRIGTICRCGGYITIYDDIDGLWCTLAYYIVL